MRKQNVSEKEQVEENENRQKMIIMPQLYDYNGNTNKQWFVFYSVLDPKSGKLRRYRVYKGFTGLTKAKKYEHAKELIGYLRTKLKNGWSPITGDETVVYMDNVAYEGHRYKYEEVRSNVKNIRYWVAKFLEEKGKGTRESTLKIYRGQLNRLCDFAKSENMEGMHPGLFKREFAVKFTEWAFKERNAGKNTVNQYRIIAKSLWEFMTEKGVTSENIFDKIKRMRFQSKSPRIYNQEVMGKLAKTIIETDPQLMVAIRMIYNCLIRPGELRSLKIKHIDFERGTITIPAEISKVKKTRVVDIPDYFVKQLKEEEYDKCPADYYIIGKDSKPHAKRVHASFIGDRHRVARKAAKISNEYILYAFKHTGMVDMKMRGIDVLDIRNQAGHKSLDQTAEYLQELMGLRSRKIREEGPRI